MNFLLDTHIFIWAIFEPEKIPKKSRAAILHTDSSVYISIITFWEISLKFTVGKINLKGVLPDKLPEIARNDGFKILDLDADTTSSFYKLPKVKNQDPFDRMLAWQAIKKDFHLLTKDRDFADYKDHGLKIVW